jgi:hypothetical protein
MTPESWNSQLLENVSLKYVTVTRDRHALTHELLEVVTSIRFAPSYKRGTRNCGGNVVLSLRRVLYSKTDWPTEPSVVT